MMTAEQQITALQSEIDRQQFVIKQYRNESDETAIQLDDLYDEIIALRKAIVRLATE